MIAASGARLIVPGVLLAGIAFGFGLIDTALLQPRRGHEQRLAQIHEDLADVRQRRARVEGDLAGLRQVPARDPGSLAFQSADGAATVAQVQELVRSVTAQVGGILLSSQPGAEEPSKDGYVGFQVLIRVQLSEEGLFRFLRELERMQPPILLKAFEVSSARGPADRPALDFAGVLMAFRRDAS